jgi:hypothetical protein
MAQRSHDRPGASWTDLIRRGCPCSNMATGPGQSPYSRSRRFSAVSRHSIKVWPLKGLFRKPIAPAFIARARTLSSWKAVMKIIGVRRPWAINRLCSSTPLMPGIWTSAITHDVSFMRGDCRKSAAEANVHAVNPSERSRLCVATRTDSSSSMIEITGPWDNWAILCACEEKDLHRNGAIARGRVLHKTRSEYHT